MNRAVVLVASLVVLLAGGATSLAGVGQARPTGKLAFTDGELFVANADGSGRQRLTRGAADYVDVYPRWSPDGRLLAFAREHYDPSGREIYVIGRDGKGLRRVASPGTRSRSTFLIPTGESAPEWSPNGANLVFARLLDGVYVIKPDGTSERQLTPTPTAGDHYTEPSWSPDGRRILFVRIRYTMGLDPVEGGIYVVNRNETGLRRLTRNTEDSEPAWSPDGRRIIFVRGLPSDLYVMNASGSGVKRLTKNPYDDLNPEWSPDGRRISFTCERGSRAQADLCMMNADGSDVRRLRSTRSWSSNATWSPDGAWLAFASERGPGYEIRVMTVDGKNVRLAARSASGDSPRWDPARG